MLYPEDVVPLRSCFSSTSANKVGEICVPVSPVDRLAAEHVAGFIAVGH